MIGRRSADAWASDTPGFKRPSRWTELHVFREVTSLERHRQVDVRASPHEPLRHHADHRPDDIVQAKLAPEHSRVAAELPLPEAIAQDDDRRRARRASSALVSGRSTAARPSRRTC